MNTTPSWLQQVNIIPTSEALLQAEAALKAAATEEAAQEAEAVLLSTMLGELAAGVKG